MMTRRTGMRWGGAFALLSLGVVGFAWLNAPKPPRAVFRPADAWGIGQGFAEGGRTFLTYGPAGTVVWDTSTWQARSTWPLLASQLRAISRDGRIGIGVHGYDDKSVPIVVIDLATGEVRHRLEAGLPGVAAATFADDNQTIRAFLTDRDGFVREVASWDLASESVVRVPIGGAGPGSTGPQPVAIAPDGVTCVVLDFNLGRLTLWDARTNQTSGAVLQVAPGRVTHWGGIAFTLDGHSLLIGKADGQIEIWDLATARIVRTIMAHPSGKSVRTIQIGADGRTVLSVGMDLTGSRLSRHIDDLTRALGISQGNDSEVAVVDLMTGQTLDRWPGSVSAYLAPDGRTVVTQQPDFSFAVRDIPPLPPP